MVPPIVAEPRLIKTPPPLRSREEEASSLKEKCKNLKLKDGTSVLTAFEKKVKAGEYQDTPEGLKAFLEKTLDRQISEYVASKNWKSVVTQNKSAKAKYREIAHHELVPSYETLLDEMLNFAKNGGSFELGDYIEDLSRASLDKRWEIASSLPGEYSRPAHQTIRYGSSEYYALVSQFESDMIKDEAQFEEQMQALIAQTEGKINEIEKLLKSNNVKGAEALKTELERIKTELEKYQINNGEKLREGDKQKIREYHDQAERLVSQIAKVKNADERVIVIGKVISIEDTEVSIVVAIKDNLKSEDASQASFGVEVLKKSKGLHQKVGEECRKDIEESKKLKKQYVAVETKRTKAAKELLEVIKQLGINIGGNNLAVLQSLANETVESSTANAIPADFSTLGKDRNLGTVWKYVLEIHRTIEDSKKDVLEKIEARIEEEEKFQEQLDEIAKKKLEKKRAALKEIKKLFAECEQAMAEVLSRIDRDGVITDRDIKELVDILGKFKNILRKLKSIKGVDNKLAEPINKAITGVTERIIKLKEFLRFVKTIKSATLTKDRDAFIIAGQLHKEAVGDGLSREEASKILGVKFNKESFAVLWLGKHDEWFNEELVKGHGDLCDAGFTIALNTSSREELEGLAAHEGKFILNDLDKHKKRVISGLSRFKLMGENFGSLNRKKIKDILEKLSSKLLKEVEQKPKLAKNSFEHKQAVILYRILQEAYEATEGQEKELDTWLTSSTQKAIRQYLYEKGAASRHDPNAGLRKYNELVEILQELPEECKAYAVFEDQVLNLLETGRFDLEAVLSADRAPRGVNV